MYIYIYIYIYNSITDIIVSHTLTSDCNVKYVIFQQNLVIVLFSVFEKIVSLQWRHNERDGVSNHQSCNCLLNRLFKARIKENIKAPCHWPLCWGIHRWPVNSPHKWPVTWKMLSFDDVIIQETISWTNVSQGLRGAFQKHLWALKFAPVNKIHIFECMGMIFCVEFQRYPLKFHTQYLSHTLKDMTTLKF